MSEFENKLKALSQAKELEKRQAFEAVLSKCQAAIVGLKTKEEMLCSIAKELSEPILQAVKDHYLDGNGILTSELTISFGGKTGTEKLGIPIEDFFMIRGYFPTTLTAGWPEELRKINKGAELYLRQSLKWNHTDTARHSDSLCISLNFEGKNLNVFIEGSKPGQSQSLVLNTKSANKQDSLQEAVLKILEDLNT